MAKPQNTQVGYSMGVLTETQVFVFDFVQSLVFVDGLFALPAFWKVALWFVGSDSAVPSYLALQYSTYISQILFDK